MLNVNEYCLIDVTRVNMMSCALFISHFPALMRIPQLIAVKQTGNLRSKTHHSNQLVSNVISPMLGTRLVYTTD